MYIGNKNDFLLLMQPESNFVRPEYMKGLVVRTKLRQCGHFMVGRGRIAGHEICIEGAYGDNGLPVTVPDDIYRSHGLAVPPELFHKWNKGGGHNSCGSEMWDMRDWAVENLAQLKRRFNIKHRVLGTPCLDGMEDEEVEHLKNQINKAPRTWAREHYGSVSGNYGAAETIASICGLLLIARMHRKNGNIDSALCIENEIIEKNYQSLPEYARW